MDGSTYDPALDGPRLRTLHERVFSFMDSGNAWYTFREIQDVCGGSEAGISARLRDFRKAKHGGHTVERRRLGDPRHGAYEYRLLVRARQVEQADLMDVKPRGIQHDY